MIDSPFNVVFLFNIIVLVAIAFFQSVKSVKTWQRKEYRFDKMADFFKTREALLFVFDEPFYLLSLFILLSISPLYTETNGRLLLLAQTLLTGFLLTTATWFIVKAIQKKLHPVITTKSILLVSLTSILLIASASAAFFTQLTLFLLPLLVPFAATYVVIVILYPLDLFFKNRIWQKAQKYRTLALQNTKVIAVSGSYGKTTVKEFLAQLLQIKFRTEKTLKYQNTTLSVAQRILSLHKKTEVFVCEIGAYRVGDGIDMCVFALPNAAIITGLNDQHYSLFGSSQNIIQAESESLQFLKKGDPVLINMNSEMCRQIQVPKHLNLIKYGLADSTNPTPLDYFADELFFDGQFTQFTLHIQEKTLRIKTNTLSTGNIQNLVGAIAMAHTLGVPLSEITQLITHLSLPEGTLEITPQPWGKLIDDSHNANLDGVLNALNLVQQFHLPSIIALDEIMELGDKAEDAHKKVAQAVAKLAPKAVVLLGKSYPDIIRSELIHLQYPHHQIFLSDGSNTSEIIGFVQKHIGYSSTSELEGEDTLNTQSPQQISQKNSQETILLCEGFRTSVIAKSFEK